jgi:hypothetical protein
MFQDHGHLARFDAAYFEGGPGATEQLRCSSQSPDHAKPFF